MREQHMLDPAAAALGVGDVAVHVPLWIDDRRDAGCLVGDQIGRMGEAAEVVLLEDHRPGILTQPTGAASSYAAGVIPWRRMTSARAAWSGGPPAEAWRTAAISRK